MSTIQRVAQVFGWVFVVVAIWGFFVSGGSMEADPALAPKVFGLFPVNVLHNLVHLAFGVWGIMAARSIAGAKTYALWAGVIYAVLTVLGFFIPTTFGLIPIGGNDIWLHALIAIVLLGFWASARSATAAPAAGTTAGTTTTTTTTTPPPSSSPGTGGPTTAGPSAPPSESRPGGPGTAGPGTTGPGTGGGAPDRPASPPPPPPSSGEGDRRP